VVGSVRIAVSARLLRRVDVAFIDPLSSVGDNILGGDNTGRINIR
jgi:hypothetical protein